MVDLESLGLLVSSHRERLGLTQEALAELVGTNRSAVAHLEQGIRLPKPDVLQRICDCVALPNVYWQPFSRAESLQRLEFESSLSELVGRPLTVDGHDSACTTAVEEQIGQLFGATVSSSQTLDLLNGVLTFYGVRPISTDFFARYMTPTAFASIQSFEACIERYQRDAIRLFSSLREAYLELNIPTRLDESLKALGETPLTRFHERAEWDAIEQIEDARLPDLGYVSAARAKQESNERAAVKTFLKDLAAKLRAQNSTLALSAFSEKQRRRIDSLLRKFDASIRHGLFSPLFVPEPDMLEREAEALGPKTDEELTRIADTQGRASRNLARYLSADHMDLYVATSMRSDADYVSVNQFVTRLLRDARVKPLKLRYFNPTQSWVEDRIAKGLVEALMLRRCSVALYMAQKGDTFGKDSEASVALGQGKPVIVYVPKLSVGEGLVDTESLFKMERPGLIGLLNQWAPSFEIDESIDEEAIVGAILSAQISHATPSDLASAIVSQWHDFDLYGEANRVPPERRGAYRSLLDDIRNGAVTVVPAELVADVSGIFVATAIRFEQRAKLFREVHPLALQIIVATGVPNGILVVRSVEQCAKVLGDIVQNNLDLALKKDEHNYRLVERSTDSTVRVISRHRLLRYSFERYYPARPVSS